MPVCLVMAAPLQLQQLSPSAASLPPEVPMQEQHLHVTAGIDRILLIIIVYVVIIIIIIIIIVTATTAVVVIIIIIIIIIMHYRRRHHADVCSEICD